MVPPERKLFMLTCGNKDGLINDHGHDATHWRHALREFAQRIFH